MAQPLRECLLLIPCSGLDDFPETLPASDSDQVLSAWLALWHPSLIGLTHCAPRWQSADQPPHAFEGILAIAPDCAASHLPSDLAGTAERAGGWLLPAQGPWRSLQSTCLTAIGSPPGEPMNAFLQTEFAALGYAYLQIQLLTRQLRYSSNLDQLLFDTQLDQAAQAALAGDVGEAEKMLQSCFDQLGQERDHYYSLDVSLLDVTLLASTTLGQPVRTQLANDFPTTFVANADLLRQMQANHPDNAAQLQRALADRRASLAGGLDIERPHPLMSFESLKRDLDRGRAAYRQLGFEAPTVFTRFTFGQTSEMPLHLRRSGFAGAMLIAWQEGSYPSGSHAKFSWEASEGTFLNAIAPPLVDAQAATTYLTLGRRIAEALDHQHVPVFMLAHWPGSYSPFFELLQRVVSRTPALGRWQHADDFFEKTDQPYHQEHLPARKFSHDWLSAAGARSDELIQACIDYHHFSGELRWLQNLSNLAYQLENFHLTRPKKTTTSTAAEEPIESELTPEAAAPQALALSALAPELARLADRVDALFDALCDPKLSSQPDKHTNANASLATEMAQLRQQVVQRLGRVTGFTGSAPANNKDAPSSPPDPMATQMIFNPTNAPQRIGLRSGSDCVPVAGASWWYASGQSGQDRLSMIDLPGFGTVRVPFEAAAKSSTKRREATLVQSDGLLINDFLEAQIDARTGALRSLHMPGKRGNRFSLQLARREKSGASEPQYSQMQASEIQVLENSTMRGVIRAIGACLFDGQRTADFEIDYEVLRGQRVLTVRVRLKNVVRLTGSPWSSAYVLRSAWPNESSIITTRNSASRQTFSSGKTVAPDLIEIDDVDHRLYLLPSGLAFHQRVDTRFLETILTSGTTGGGEYQLGVGVDLPNAMVSAWLYHDRAYAVPLPKTASADKSSSQPAAAAWLMNIDAKSVLMHLEAPLMHADGYCCGLRLHLTELAGKSVTARIRAIREVIEAHRVDYLGGRIAKLTVEGDTTSIALRPNEMTFVDLTWKV